MYYGDIRLGDTIDIKFTTRRGDTGAPTQLAGSPAVAAYVGNGTTEITAGITLTVDFDSRTGLNNVRVVASSGNGFATATNVQLVITAGTVNAVSVVGEVIGSFSIEARSAVMPTTAARTLDVSAAGNAGIDWSNIEAPTTAQNLSGTNIKTDQKVDVDTIKTNPVVNGGTTTFPTNATLASTTNITGGTITTVTNLTNAPTAGDLTATMKTSVQTAAAAALAAFFTSAAQLVTDIWAATTRILTAGTNIVLAKGTGVTGFNDLSTTQVEDTVWDAVLANHQDAGSTGEALGDAGSAGDPWATALPGAYGAGTAGKIVGDNLNATVSSRATPAQVATEAATALTNFFTSAAQFVLDIWAATVRTVTGMTGNITGNLSGSVGSVTGNVGGNVAGNVAGSVGSVVGLTPANLDATVSSRLAAAAYTTPPTAVQNADALLGRNIDGGANGGRSVTEALSLLRNKTIIAAGVLTVYEQDGTTPMWEANVTTAAGDPLTSVSPTT